MIRNALGILSLVAASSCGAAPPSVAAGDPRSPLKLERRIELPDVKGRIDHLALDLRHRRLFVAEYGNGSVDVIDLAAGRVRSRMTGLREPQGVAFLAAQAEIAVACGDGSVHFYSAADRREVARIDLGEDADNVAVDARNGHLIVGYGGGGLAVIDPATHRVLARLKLPGHPEGFRLIGARALVNLPDRGAIVAGDVDTSEIRAIWPTGAYRMNFPLAVDRSGAWFEIAYRSPPAVARIDPMTGRTFSVRPTCGDADDLFADGGDLYVLCGAGRIEIIPASGLPIRVETKAGARTGLLSTELRTLFLAAPAGPGPAAIWVLGIGPGR